MRHAFCLSVHAAYACRHSGACCKAPWAIPLAVGDVHALRTWREISEILDHADNTSYVGRRHDGSCVFFEEASERLCTIHRLAGADRLPSACRHFPRVVLHDPRGTFITLSSFCPTAAAMLLDDVPLRIVDAPASLALDGRLEGLDADAVLPPLLRPGVLMDYDGYSAWERAAIAVLDRDDLHPHQAIDIIASATRRVQGWNPGGDSLAAYVVDAFTRVVGSAAHSGLPRRSLREGGRRLRMFMAAHLFGSWAAYQHGGLHAIVDEVRNALSLAEEELASGQPFVDAVRTTDLKLRHTRDDERS
jgi:hypothetical protein